MDFCATLKPVGDSVCCAFGLRKAETIANFVEFPNIYK